MPVSSMEKYKFKQKPSRQNMYISEEKEQHATRDMRVGGDAKEVATHC